MVLAPQLVRVHRCRESSGLGPSRAAYCSRAAESRTRSLDRRRRCGARVDELLDERLDAEIETFQRP